MSSTEMNEAEMQDIVPEEVAGTTDETTNTLEKSLAKDETKPEIVKTLALIKPDAMQANNKEAIVNKIKENNFIISQEQEIQLTKEKAGLFYKEHTGKPFYEDLTNWMSSSPIYALVLEKQDAIKDWRELMGPTNALKAREEKPNSIRALFGTDGSHNATHGSDSAASAEREIELIFGQPSETLPEVEGVEPLDKEVDSDMICKPDAANNDTDETTVDKEVEQVKISEPISAATDAPISNTAEDVGTNPKTNITSEQSTEIPIPSANPNVTEKGINNDSDTISNTLSTAVESHGSNLVDHAEPILIAPSSANDICSVLEPIDNINTSNVTAKDNEAEKPNVREESSAEDEATITNEKEVTTKQQQSDLQTKKYFSEEDFIVNANSKNSPLEEEEEEEVKIVNTADKDDEDKDTLLEEKKIGTSELNVDADVKVTSVTNVEAKVEQPKVETELVPVNNTEVAEEPTAVVRLISTVDDALVEESKDIEESTLSVADEKESSEEKLDEKDQKVVESTEEVNNNTEEKIISVQEPENKGAGVVQLEQDNVNTREEVPKLKKKSVGALVAAFETAKEATHAGVKDLTTAFEQQNEKDTKLEEETRKVEINMQEKSESVAVSEPIVETPVIKDEIKDDAFVDTDKEQQHVIPTSETTGDADNVPTSCNANEEDNVPRTVEDTVSELNGAAEEAKTNNEDDVVAIQNNTNNKPDLKVEQKDSGFIPQESMNEADINSDVNDKQNTLEQNLSINEQTSLVLSNNKEEDKEDNVTEESLIKSATTSTTNTSVDENESNATVSEEEEVLTNEDHQSENSSVTNSATTSSSNEKNKEVIGETIKKPSNKVSSVNNKKELKSRAPINKKSTTQIHSGIDGGDKKRGGVTTTTATKKTLTKPANVKDSSIGTKRPSTTVKKPATATGKEPVTATGDKPIKKTARVPRVALLTKKIATPSPAATETEEKPKKATSTRSLVSRLTAPTAASARRKEITTPASSSAAAGSSVRKSDPSHKKVNTSLTTSPPSTTATKKTIKKVPLTGSRVSTTHAKPTITTAGARHTTPPSSTATSKKTSEATHAIKQQRIATNVNNKTGTRASGLPKTTKKEVPIVAQKKTSATLRKKPVTAAAVSDSTSAATTSSATKEDDQVVSTTASTTSGHSHDEEENIETPIQADIIDEDQKTESNVHKGEEENHVVQNDEITHTNKEIEHKQLDEDHTTNEVKVTLEEESTKVVEPTNKEEEAIKLVEPTINQEEEDVKVVEPTIEQEETTKIVKPSNEQEETTKIVEPITKEELVTVVISEDTPQIVESNHDAEVAAITQPIITTTATTTTPAIKPQMASLRSRFENLNSNNSNQFPTSKSKELRSKSPNRISDMINRFS